MLIQWYLYVCITISKTLINTFSQMFVFGSIWLWLLNIFVFLMVISLSGYIVSFWTHLKVQYTYIRYICNIPQYMHIHVLVSGFGSYKPELLIHETTTFWKSFLKWCLIFLTWHQPNGIKHVLLFLLISTGTLPALIASMEGSFELSCRKEIMGGKQRVLFTMEDI